MKAKNYPNLYRKAGQPHWVFSKYSAARGGEFRVSTGIEATESNAAAAYKHGMARFNEWMGASALRSGRDPLIRDIAKIVTESKKAKSLGTQIRFRSEFENNIGPAFGHLRPSQVTSLRLQQYENDARARGRRCLFNFKKYLFEILRLAKREGLIRELPVWKLSDPDSEDPRKIPPAVFRRIRRLIFGPEKLVLFVMYHQGGRPGEIIQYRWEMINWRESTLSIPKAITKTRRQRIIPINSRVLRVFRLLQKEFGPIFPGRGPGRADRSRRVYDRGWNRAMETLGLDFTIYNLRDSFITTKLEEGLSHVYVAKYVDSSVREIERRYAVPMSDAMRKIAR